MPVGRSAMLVSVQCPLQSAVMKYVCMKYFGWNLNLDIKLQFLKILFKTKTCELCFIFYKVSQWQYNKATLSALWIGQNQHQVLFMAGYIIFQADFFEKQKK